MTRACSLKPAKTKVYRVSFIGPKGGYHHGTFQFKLNQIISPLDIHKPRAQEILRKMKADGWIVRLVDWYNSSIVAANGGRYPSSPHSVLLYRIHRNDVYINRQVKAGWRIAGEY